MCKTGLITLNLSRYSCKTPTLLQLRNFGLSWAPWCVSRETHLMCALKTSPHPISGLVEQASDRALEKSHMQNDKEKLFRKIALERLSSPEQLDSLMRVITPKAWLALLP